MLDDIKPDMACVPLSQERIKKMFLQGGLKNENVKTRKA